MGVPCATGYVPPVEGECCSTCPECRDGEDDRSDPCMPKTCVDGSWLTAHVDCPEYMGVPCATGYVPAEEGQCCSTCPECREGEDDNSDPCIHKTCVRGSWLEAHVDCAEAMGVPCAAGYVPAEEGQCCSTCPIEEDLCSWEDPVVDTIADGILIENGDLRHFENVDSIEGCMAICDTYDYLDC